MSKTLDGSSADVAPTRSATSPARVAWATRSRSPASPSTTARSLACSWRPWPT